MINPAIQFNIASREEKLLFIECSSKIIRNIDRNITSGKVSEKDLTKYLSVRWYLNHMHTAN